MLFWLPMFRQFIYPLFLGILLSSCGGNATKPGKTDSAKTVKTEAEKQPATGDKVIASDAETAISETNRNAVLLFGKTIQVQPAGLQSQLPQTVIEMNLMMTNAGAVAKGPLTFAYLTPPGKGLQKIFIGQPVGARFDSDNGFHFITVPGGTYFKMQ